MHIFALLSVFLVGHEEILFPSCGEGREGGDRKKIQRKRKVRTKIEEKKKGRGTREEERREKEERRKRKDMSRDVCSCGW